MPGGTGTTATRQEPSALLPLCWPFRQKSKFLEFVNKMSRGEVALEDGAVKPGVAGVGQADQWADEFDGLHHHQHQRGAQGWADEFLNAVRRLPSTDTEIRIPGRRTAATHCML